MLRAATYWGGITHSILKNEDKQDIIVNVWSIYLWSDSMIMLHREV
jgi:hypothetical protein